MFPILPKVLLIIAFFITVINSTPRPDAEIFDLNPDVAPSTNIFLDGISYDDSSIPIGDQQNLFAGNPGTSESCSAEDWQSFSAIGRLRQRRGSPSGSSEGKSCIWTVAPIEESIDPDLLRLPIVDDWVEPANEGRPDICPPFVFQDRDIPLCSAEKLVTRPTLDMRDTLIQKAKAYNPFYGCLPDEKLYCCSSVSLNAPDDRKAEPSGWGITGYDCMENTLFGFNLQP